jgi:predicted MFS family arabinose efflux permease
MSLRFRVVNYLLFTNGVLVYYLLPYFFGVFSDEHQIGANQLSLLMSADMAGGALAALAARYWLSKWHWHGVFIPATIVAVAANVASIYATTATEFMVCRALAGLASGSLMAFAYACLGGAENADKEFSLALGAQTAVGALLLTFTPNLLERWGGDALFVILALLSLLPWLLLTSLPKQNPVREVAEKQVGLPLSNIAALCSIMIYMAALTAIWVVAEQVAGDLGFSTKLIGLALSASLLFSFLGAVAPALVLEKVGRFQLITFSYSALALALLLVEQSAVPLLFAIGLCLYNFFYSFTMPMQMAWFSAFDASGRTVVLVSLAQGVGASLGPSLGVYLFSHYGATAVFVCCFMLLILSFGLIYTANKAHPDQAK